MVILSKLKKNTALPHFHLYISQTKATLLTKMHTRKILVWRNSKTNYCLEPGSCREADSNLVGLKPDKGF